MDTDWLQTGYIRPEFLIRDIKNFILAVNDFGELVYIAHKVDVVTSALKGTEILITVHVYVDELTGIKTNPVAHIIKVLLETRQYSFIIDGYLIKGNLHFVTSYFCNRIFSLCFTQLGECGTLIM